MNNRIELDKVEQVLLDEKLDPVKVEQIISQLQLLIEEQPNEPLTDETKTDENESDETESDEENLPKVKYEYVIILNDKEGYLKDKEIAGWVVQQEENTDAGLLVSKLSKAAKDQNAGAKKKHAMDDLTSVFEYLKPKFIKEQHIKIKTKDLTRVIVSNGKLY